ncbi:hypothetical protein ACUH97_08015 [Dermabacteraceae bacterium P13088]
MPRIFTPPLRELTPETSFGFEACDLWRDAFGYELMPHQREVLVRSLELEPGAFTSDEFPKLRFKTVLILIARQNGKTYVMSARALWRMLMWQGPGEGAPLILGLAHKLDAAEEILSTAIKTLRGCDETRQLIAHVHNTNGNKYVEMHNGARWKAQAANDDAGRSLSVTDLLFDELRQQRSWDPWTAAENTTNSIFSSQVIGVSNAGEDKSVVLKGLREKAIKEADSLRAWIDEHGTYEGWDGNRSLCILEWSSPDGADIHDVHALAQANPAMNREQNGRVFLTSQMLLDKADLVGTNGMPEHRFRTEIMCQHVTVEADPPFPPEQVEACTDEGSAGAEGAPVVYAVDVSHDRSTAWIAAATFREDERAHVEVITRRPGVHWVDDFLSALVTPGPVVIQGRGAPASSLITWLAKKEHDIRRCEGTELTNSLSQFDDALAEGTVRFRPQGALERAMSNGARRPTGEVALLDRSNSPVDISPLCAVVMALWGLMNLDLEPAKKPDSAYGDNYGEWYDGAAEPVPENDTDRGWWE